MSRPTIFRRVMCAVGQHRLFRIARVGYGTFKVGCLDCPRLWGMNDAMRAVLPWRDVAELYEGPAATFPESGWTKFKRPTQ